VALAAAPSRRHDDVTSTRDSARSDRPSLHQIGEVADLIGLSIRTIRHYEEVGVVVPADRSAAGYRLYSDRDIVRLRRVMGMKPLGFSLEEIREVLDLLDASDVDPLPSDVDPLPSDVDEGLAAYARLAAEREEKCERQLASAAEFTAHLQQALSSSMRYRSSESPSSS
jgi:DNA-binding transcriptional MerR regulator